MNHSAHRHTISTTQQPQLQLPDTEKQLKLHRRTDLVLLTSRPARNSGKSHNTINHSAQQHTILTIQQPQLQQPQKQPRQVL